MKDVIATSTGENALGQKLRRLREAKGITRRSISQQLGCYELTIYNYEQKATIPDSATLHKLADVLKVDHDTRNLLFSLATPANADEKMTMTQWMGSTTRLGAVLRRLREDRCMTQSDVRKETGISAAKIGKYESSLYVSPKERLAKLAQLFFTPDEVVVGTNIKKCDWLENLAKRQEDIASR